MTRWTRERPTKPGAYWNRTGRGDVQMVVIVEGSHWNLEVNCQGDTDLQNYGGEWQGPITPEE